MLQKENSIELEKAILIGIIKSGDSEDLIQEYLDELEFLADTAGAVVLKMFTQKLDKPNPATYIGSGKMMEIAGYIEDNKIDIAIFDDELSPSQIRNLEKEFKVKILDRTNLILDIFAKRAQTAHSKVQVELAQYKYLLPRLTGMWTHLERQKGGIGLRGPGESEIETDRRIIRDKIAKLKEQLLKIDKQKVTQRKNRGNIIRVSLVGYTNVGKSTVMNLISKSEVFAENKLFATLDTTVRKVVIDNLPFLLSDTVGFIRKLPHDLVESFKSTLDEVRESDILVHIVDVSHPQFEDHINVVNNTIQEIGVVDKPTILVFNKIDAFTYTPKEPDDLTPSTKENRSLDDFKQMYFAQNVTSIFISARQKINIDEFKQLLHSIVKEEHLKRYPYTDSVFS
ncbi:MAG: GTPase HflX [Bacteroidales bacterium]|nr:GTPase HflX [Bacteroidales bacterium]